MRGSGGNIALISPLELKMSLRVHIENMFIGDSGVLANISTVWDIRLFLKLKRKLQKKIF